MVTKAPRMSREPRYDIHIADFRKNAQEQVRCSLHEFRGLDMFSVRVWVDLGAGHNPDKIVPTRKGLTINASLLPALHEAIDKAMQEAVTRVL